MYNAFDAGDQDEKDPPIPSCPGKRAPNSHACDGSTDYCKGTASMDNRTDLQDIATILSSASWLLIEH
jgi:hypothetical protein